MVGKVDIKKLKADAVNSCCKESYLVLEKNSTFRIGAGARVGDDSDILLFIDVSINLCPGNSNLNTSVLEKGILLAKKLKGLNYELDCQDGQINCEKEISGNELNTEYDSIIEILDELKIVS